MCCVTVRVSDGSEHQELRYFLDSNCDKLLDSEEAFVPTVVRSYEVSDCSSARSSHHWSCVIIVLEYKGLTVRDRLCAEWFQK